MKENNDNYVVVRVLSVMSITSTFVLKSWSLFYAITPDSSLPMNSPEKVNSNKLYCASFGFMTSFVCHVFQFSFFLLSFGTGVVITALHCSEVMITWVFWMIVTVAKEVWLFLVNMMLPARVVEEIVCFFITVITVRVFFRSLKSYCGGTVPPVELTTIPNPDNDIMRPPPGMELEDNFNAWVIREEFSLREESYIEYGGDPRTINTECLKNVKFGNQNSVCQQVLQDLVESSFQAKFYQDARLYQSSSLSEESADLNQNNGDSDGDYDVECSSESDHFLPSRMPSDVHLSSDDEFEFSDAQFTYDILQEESSFEEVSATDSDEVNDGDDHDEEEYYPQIGEMPSHVNKRDDEKGVENDDMSQN